MYEIVINIVAGEEPFTGTLLQGETIISTHNFPTTGIHIIPVDNPGEYQLLIVDSLGCEQLIEYIIIDATTSTSTSTSSTSTSTTTEEITTTSTTTIEVSTTTTSTTEDITTTTTTTTAEECCFGLLYNWYSTQGSGSDSITSSDDWRIPSSSDINNILGYIDPLYNPDWQWSETAGSHLKHTSCWQSPNTGALNTYNFNGKPNAFRSDSTGEFFDFGQVHNCWLSDLDEGSQLCVLFGTYNNEEAWFTTTDPGYGYCIRIMRDVNEAEELLNDGEIIDTYIGNDGEIYNAVKIGSQVWIDRDLIETKLRSGVCISEITDNQEWVDSLIPSMCAFDNDWSYICTEQPECTTTSTTTEELTTTSTTTEEITTTTSTTTSIIVGECYVLINTLDEPTKIYSYNPDTEESQELSFSTLSRSDDITHTANKLWLNAYEWSSECLNEWDITLNPFTASYNRRVCNVPNSFGLFAVDDTTLISVSNFTHITPSRWAVYECDITTGTSVNTYKFDMIANRYIVGDFVLTSDNKFIATTYRNISGTRYSWITQYSYPDGAVEVDVEITAITTYPLGVFEHEGEIYYGDKNGPIYRIDRNYPYASTLVDTVPYTVSGASQLASCITGSFNTTTTTTTTSEITTTTTTTLEPVPTTTTTTTGECEQGWGYAITIYYCDCNVTGGGSIGNSDQLTVGKFYYSPLLNYIISIDSFLGCGYAINSYISDVDKKDTCAEVICPTTTTTTTTTP